MVALTLTRLTSAALALGVGVEAAKAVTQAPRAALLPNFKPGVQWQIDIHQPIKSNSPSDFIPQEAVVWDIDLSHAQTHFNMIPTLKEAGKIVICYLNVGAVQNWDSDKSQFPKAVIGRSLDYPYVGDEGEWYLNIKDSRVVNLMKKRFDAAVEVGCDAVDPDNVDAWVQDDGTDPTGFKLKMSDYVKYLNTLAAYAHSLKTRAGGPLLIGQKNAPEIVEPIMSNMDFAVLESCRGSNNPKEESWPFCPDFQGYIAQGKPVFQIEYPPSAAKKKGVVSAADNKFFCSASNDDKGYSKILKWASERLDGWGQYCGGKPFRTPVDYD